MTIFIQSFLPPAKLSTWRHLHSGSLTVLNGTLAGNTSNPDNGGGIETRCHNGNINCTLSGNHAKDLDGDVYTTGTLTVTNSTLKSFSASALELSFHRIKPIM